MPFLGLFAPPDVAKLKARRDVEGLIKALSYQKEAAVRCLAAEALGEIGDARAVNPLIAALEGPALDVQEAAAHSLASIGAPAIEPLAAALKSSKSPARVNIVAVLGEIGGATAVKLLVEALRNADWHTRQAAADALGQAGGLPEVGALLVALDDWDWNVRQAAARSLGRIGDASAAAPLVEALKYPEPDAREAVAEALTKIGRPAIEHLIKTFRHWDPGVREAAARTLQRITGQDFGEDATLWDEWWEEQKQLALWDRRKNAKTVQDHCRKAP